MDDLKRITTLIIGILICLSVFLGCKITVKDDAPELNASSDEIINAETYQDDVIADNIADINNINNNIITDGIVADSSIIDAQINVFTQEYDGNNIAEILTMSSETENANIDRINGLILNDIQQPYNQFKANQDDYGWVEIKSYPFTSRDYLQIVTTYVEYPIYGTDGEIYSYNFSLTKGRYIELSEIMNDLGLTDAALTQKIQDLYARDVREEDESVIKVTAKGFLITANYDESPEPVTQLLLKVTIQHPGADSWESFFSYIPQTDELLRLQSDLFDSNEPDKMDPPLWYERRMAYGGIELDD